MAELDHLVMATADLAAGTAWLEAKLAVPVQGGGRHPLFGTHNALWRMGDVYLELIAADPDAPVLGRPRLFALDDAAMRARIAERPVLVHWVLRTGDAEAEMAALGYDPGPPVAMSRGDLHWRLTVRGDGSMAAGGLLPSLVEWPGDVTRPPQAMGDSGLRLAALLVTGAEEDIAHVPDLPRVHTARGTAGLAAEITRPDGSRWRVAAQI